MVNSMSGGDLKIEVLPVGAVLKTAEIADGVSKGPLFSQIQIIHPVNPVNPV